jgi:pullulanase
MEESVKFGIVAACNHPQVDMKKVNYSKKGYAAAPWNVITYCECHDNNTLWDKLSLSCTGASKEELIKMHTLALTIVLTSQGIPFLHAGTEFLRNKKGLENSFNAGDSINAIDWKMKNTNKDVNDYVVALIKMRKEHPAFRLTSNEQIKNCIRFEDKLPEGVIAYTINGAAVKDKWKKIFIAFNGSSQDKLINGQPGRWKQAFSKAAVEKNTQLSVPAFSALILYME